MERDDGRRHHREARILRSHLVNRAVGALNRQLHQVLDVLAILNPVAKGFVENVDGRLRSHFAGIGAADAIGNHKDAAFGIGEKRVFVKRTFFAQSAIRNRSDVEIILGRRTAHSTASKAIDGSGSCSILATARASKALRCEKAINIPSMAKLVIKLKPPWLTNGKVIPVMGRARVMPPMLTNA